MIDRAAALHALKADGIHRLPGFLDAPTLDALRAECELLLRKGWIDFLWDGSFRFARPAAHIPGRSVTLKLKKLKMDLVPEIARLFESSELGEIASAYLPAGSTVNDAAVLSHEHEPGDLTNIHFDTVRSLKSSST